MVVQILGLLVDDIQCYSYVMGLSRQKCSWISEPKIKLCENITPKTFFTVVSVIQIACPVNT